MNKWAFEIVPAKKVDLKSKTGLRDALIANSNGLFAVGENPVQQAFLNKMLNRKKFNIA